MHRPNRQILSTAIIAALGAGLAACSGGDSSSSDDSRATADSAQITQSNADTIIDTAFMPQTALFIFAESLAETVLGGDDDGGSPVTKAGRSAAGRGGESLIPTSMLANLGGKRSAPRATESCIGGGSITVIETDVNNDGVGAGDSVSVQFNNCSAEGTTVNGGVVMTINQLSNTQSSGELGIGFSFDELNVQDDGDVVDIDGNLTYDISYDSSHDDIIVSSSGLSFSINAASLNFSHYRLQDMFYVADGSWTSDLDFVVSGSLIGGQITTVTDPLLRGDADISGNPLSGVITFTGQPGDSIRLDAGTGDPETVMKTVNGVSEVVYWYELDL